MSYFDILASLLPQGPYDPSQQTLSALLNSIGAQMDIQDANGDILAGNGSPYTADVNGIVLWEQLLGLPSDDSLSLTERQQRCIAKAFRLPGVLTTGKLIDILNSFSPGKLAAVLQSPSTYQVTGILGIDDVNDYQQVLRAVAAFLPAHLQFIMGFLITPIEQAKPLASNLITVSRNAFVNNGGPASTGYFLDGTWPLDGSELMDNLGAAGPTPASSVQLNLNLSAVFGGGYQVTQGGYLLNGGPLLDGSWDLIGATIGTASPAAYQVSFNGVPVV